ncbi:unnamed protein product [[Candida] boidinii]|uniref:Unnamed protein product n=1 Tax=Candida boidinii TaxID=5477 RepID=A0A9W6WFU9_CANBO|nr:hypothetical protein BVG19_g75 [[Candida] boidinii]OWB49643.1 hypothetical protein B5S27_g1185 [[Candida] boidinii]OWB65238.1 hypothetical protein B5S30_g562 [[Candida] boidinii]OWB84015.1 hypothetical protein B5S33_g2652 [[Candida] boidinii]GME69795.1 unnamed protein product [[Candida] boidinii]
MSVVAVTGASRGLGRAIASIVLTCEKDTKIVAIARSADKLKELEAEFGSERVAIVTGDICDKEVAKKVVNTAVQKFGKLDSIVFNAGVLDPIKPLEFADIAAWRNLFEVNFFSIVGLLSEAIPELRKSKGNAIFVSSSASVFPYDAWAAYGCSKAALNRLALSLADEEKEIGALAVDPGVVRTGMQVNIRENLGQHMKEEALQQFKDLHENDQLLPPEVPGSVYAKLAVYGVPDDLSGQYIVHDDEKLKKFFL